MKAFLNASQLAKLINVDRSTIIRWINTGVIRGAMQSHHGRKDWQIPLSAYQELLKTRS